MIPGPTVVILGWIFAVVYFTGLAVWASTYQVRLEATRGMNNNACVLPFQNKKVSLVTPFLT